MLCATWWLIPLPPAPRLPPVGGLSPDRLLPGQEAVLAQPLVEFLQKQRMQVFEVGHAVPARTGRN